MKFVLVDFWMEKLTFKLLPKAKDLIVVCSSNCKISGKVAKRCIVVKDPSKIEEGKSWIIKTSSDIHKGFLICLLVSRLNPEVYSHRSEILEKSLGGCRVEALVVPYVKVGGRGIRKVEVEKDKEKIKEGGSKNMEIVGGNLNSIKKENGLDTNEGYFNDFDKVYMDSLCKYVSIILTTPSKADKSKSARAQIRNIVDGMITSHQKKNSGFKIVSSIQVADAIIDDLEKHDVMTLNPVSVYYNEYNILQYFGTHKTKEFEPQHKNKENFEMKAEPEIVQKVENFDEIINSVFDECEKNEKVLKSTNVGELHYYTYIIFSKSTNTPYSELQSSSNQKMITKIIEKLLTTHFDLDKDVIQDIYSNFSVKLKNIN